jgi:hypothetical protein
MNNLDLLKVYNFPNKSRYGINQDGGYVIANLICNYDCYISAGISNEESFSRDFINKYNFNKGNSFAFDGTINDYPYHYTDKITFLKKNISNINNEMYTDLSFLTERYDNIFLKMDIEGSEYPWILSQDIAQLNKFKQIVIEFHGITGNGWNSNYDDKIKCLEKLNKTHYIVHAHGNNNGAVINHIPDVIELTYVNKNYFTVPPELNTIPLPIRNLDFPNHILYPEIKLNIYPFVQNVQNSIPRIIKYYENPKIINRNRSNIRPTTRINIKQLSDNPNTDYSTNFAKNKKSMNILSKIKSDKIIIKKI